MSMRSTARRHAPRAALASVLLAVLTACGGGGGGSTDPQAGEALALAAGNAHQSAGAALVASTIGEAGSFGQDLTATASQAVVQQARRAQRLAVRVAGERTAQAAQTLNCAVSGTVTVSLSGTGTLQAAGDGLSISANACNDGDGTVVDGLMSLTLSRYTDAQNFAFSLSFTSFSATSTSGSDLVQLSGSLSAVYSGGNQTVIASSGLSAQARLAGQNRSVVVTGFSATIVDQGTQYTETLAGTFSLGALEGRSVVLSTVTPVVQRVDDLYPSSGALRLVGAGGSALLIEAVDASQARLSLDANGDGSYESVETVAWDALG